MEPKSQEDIDAERPQKLTSKKIILMCLKVKLFIQE